MTTLDYKTGSTLPNASYRPVAMRYGAIWGGVSIVLTLLGFLTNTDPSMPNTSTSIKIIYGLIGFGVSIWAVVMAIRHHRDRDLGGHITLGRAVMVGLMTGLVAGLIGGVFMLLYTSVINPGYSDTIRDMTSAQMEEQGMSEEQIEMAGGFTGWMFNPVFMFLSQVLGGAVAGIIIGLIAGAIMKRELPRV